MPRRLGVEAKSFFKLEPALHPNALYWSPPLFRPLPICLTKVFRSKLWNLTEANKQCKDAQTSSSGSAVLDFA